jgi:hypothetical protein
VINWPEQLDRRYYGGDLAQFLATCRDHKVWLHDQEVVDWLDAHDATGEAS